MKLIKAIDTNEVYNFLVRTNSLFSFRVYVGGVSRSIILEEKTSEVIFERCVNG